VGAAYPLPAPQSAEERVCVVGVTAWGLTLADLFARAGSPVTLLTRDAAECDLVRQRRTDPARIAAVHLPAGVAVTEQPAVALAGATVVVLAVPAQRLRANVARVAPHLPPGCAIVSAAKGIEQSSGLRMTELIGLGLPPGGAACALSGPNLAEEIARGLPATCVIAGPPRAAARVQATLNSPRFRVYTHDDVVGVELGGALKNVIALAAGVNDGLGYGENAKAALLTRCLAEMIRLGTALGASPLTFAGLSGLGDLIATCAGSLSRNHRVGFALGRGATLAEALAGLGHVAEGVPTTEAALTLAAQHGVELPITAGMARVLRGEISAAEGARLLLEREPRGEFSR
jgi:glycerol-3-phosphate dehydrogenase (NAD(P)+)